MKDNLAQTVVTAAMQEDPIHCAPVHYLDGRVVWEPMFLYLRTSFKDFAWRIDGIYQLKH